MMSCIYNVPIFKQLPEEHVLRLQRVMVHRQLAPGDLCARAGESVDHLYVVHEGMLRFTHVGTGGREQVIRELGPGEFYGEIGLFAEVISEGDLVAAAATEACVLERSAVQKVLQEAPDMSLSLVEALAGRLFAAERTIGELALYDVGRRLVAALLRQAANAQGLSEIGAEARLQGTVRFQMPYSWAQMATQLATTPESLSRRLGSLLDDGLVEVEGREVTIENVENLRALLFA